VRKVMLTVAVGLLVAGCGSSGGSGASGKAGEGTDAATGPIAVADAGKPIAQASFDAAGGKFGLAVVSLSANGKLAQLALSLTPHSAQPGYLNVYNFFGGTIAEASLVDPVNLKRYVPVKDSSGHALSSGNAGLAKDQANTMNYTFAAPPDNVKTISVQFGDFPPFRNIPISR
jgi:hypothetical protein